MARGCGAALVDSNREMAVLHAHLLMRSRR